MPPLSFGKTLAYSCGLFAAGMYYSFNNFTLPLYLKIFTDNNILIGWLSSTRSFEQAITQPIVGAWSDRTWTRFGRRAPFFLATMPLVALLLIFNGILPHDSSLLLVVVVTVFVFSLLFNIGIDPYFALLSDVTTNDQRGTVNGIAQFLGFLGQVAVLVGAAYLYSVHPAWVFALVGVALVIGFGIVARAIREPRELNHEKSSPVDPSPKQRWSAREIIPYLRGLVRDQREAMKLLGVRFLYSFGLNATMPFITLFIAKEIGLKGWADILLALPFLNSLDLNKIDADGLSQLVVAFLLISTVICVFPCGLLGDRIGKKPMFAIGLLVMGVSGFLAAFADTIPQILLYMPLLGFGNAAYTVLFLPYLYDLIPISRAGEFTGLAATTETGGVFLSILLAGELINMNLFGLQYRTVFIVTAIFILLALAAVTFVKPKLEIVGGGKSNGE